jgi:hypothetical protein
MKRLFFRSIAVAAYVGLLSGYCVANSSSPEPSEAPAVKPVESSIGVQQFNSVALVAVVATENDDYKKLLLATTFRSDEPYKFDDLTSRARGTGSGYEFEINPRLNDDGSVLVRLTAKLGENTIYKGDQVATLGKEIIFHLGIIPKDTHVLKVTVTGMNRAGQGPNADQFARIALATAKPVGEGVMLSSSDGCVWWVQEDRREVYTTPILNANGKPLCKKHD